MTIRVPTKEYARMERLICSARRRSCEQSCSAYWGSPRDCHCGAVKWNADRDAWMAKFAPDARRGP